MRSIIRGGAVCVLLSGLTMWVPAADAQALTCDAARSASVTVNATSQACDCKAGWAGLGCEVCTEATSCKASLPNAKGAVECNTRTYVPVKAIHGLCEATNANITNLIHGKGWVSVTAVAGGAFSFDFIKENSESKFVPLFRCSSNTTTVKTDATSQAVKYTSPDLACNLTCTVGADRTCTNILANILKSVGKNGGSTVTCDPAKAACLISENTLDTFLGGVSTTNCKLGECVEAPAARLLRAL